MPSEGMGMCCCGEVVGGRGVVAIGSRFLGRVS